MTDTVIEAPLHQELTSVDSPLQRRRLGDMTVDRFAGLTFAEYRECVEFAKLMSQAKHSVPGYLKGNAGDCLAIVTQALRWHLEPYWVAQHSYVAKAESLIAYDAAVHAAIILSSGLLKERPRYKFSDETGGPVGEDLTCTVVATFKGESTDLDYTTPPLKQCRPPKNEQGVVKGSPLWVKDPKQQLGYYAIRNWGRRHCPEVLGGVYDREEFEETTQDETDVIPPTPNLMARLPGKMEGAGFQTDVVDAGLAKEAEQAQEQAQAEKKARKAATAALGKAQDAPEGTTPSKGTTEPKPPASEPPLQPQTAGEYQAYAARWIEKGSDADDIEARWDGEKEMRANLNVPIAVRKRLEGMLRERVAALREAKRKR